MADAESKEPSLRERNAAKLPGFWAEMAAIGREAIKDIRQTANEVFFSHPEHSPESGAPLNPTQIMATDELRGDDYKKSLQQYAARSNPDKDQAPSL
jgi:hypothetical protein